MAVILDDIVPVGRSFHEYAQMFGLTAADLAQPILGMGDGPASFNAEATQRGARVISVDPIYQYSGAFILERFNAVVDAILEQVSATAEDYVWQYHASPAALRHSREQALHRFLQDYDQGKGENRYQVGALPQLSFPDQTFQLALCSHLLFLYSDHLNYAFHRSSILELLRVSCEVRIFPLLTLALARSPHLDPLLSDLSNLGYRAEICTVPYEFQKGGNEMLRIQQPSSSRG